MDVIKLTDVSKSYELNGKEEIILKNVNLQVKKGEFISIMGESGAGKSTLLYLMGALDDPSKGEIEIRNVKISEISDKEKSALRRTNIGFIFQFYNLIPEITVEENIILPILLDKKRKSDYIEKVREILEIVGLQSKARHTPKELSGGQQQRVAIARALINDPDIILADEPTGNLDTKTSKEIMDLLFTINKEIKKTIVQVTHSNKMAEYSDKIIYIKDGEIK